MMGLKKKKNIIILTLCMVICFILYQLYFFLTITSEAGSIERIIPVVDQQEVESLKTYTQKHVIVRSESDKFINNNGVIRGVLQTYMSKYRPDVNNEFKCLKSEQRIPFENVNDDYCDCEDGTDEPSTNACANGTFYCDTQLGNKPISFLVVPSGQVNDGICDCCDGSDEWLHDADKKLLSQAGLKLTRLFVTKCLNRCN